MRFTKHLTAIACAMALIGTAMPQASMADHMPRHVTGTKPIARQAPDLSLLDLLFGPRNTKEDDSWEAYDERVLAEAKQKKLAADLKADHDSFWAGTNDAVKYPQHLLPDYACGKKNKQCNDTKNAIYASLENVGITYNGVIIGVTAGGERKKLYCGTARPCTAGSLNKAAIAQGLEFMVPADMLATAGDYAYAWEDVAAILWSEEFADRYKDSNAKSARDTLATKPNVYAANRKTSLQAAAKQQTNDGNNNTTFDDNEDVADDTPADVVVDTSVVVDCDALCESEKL